MIRELGPGLYGEYGLILAYYLIATTIVLAGQSTYLQGTINPRKFHETIVEVRSSMQISFVYAIVTLTFVQIILADYLSNIGIFIHILFLLSIASKTLEIPFYALEAMQRLSRVLFLRTFTFIIFACCRVSILIFCAKDRIIDYLLILILLENIFNFVLPYIYYRIHFLNTYSDRNSPLKVNTKKYGKSFFLLLTAFSVVAYTKIDIIMLDYFTDKVELGKYIAVTKLSELTYIPLMIFSMSVAPIIVSFLHDRDNAQYENNFRLALLFIFIYSFAVILIVYFIGDTIVSLIYGTDYKGIGEVWLIYSLSCFGVGVGVFSSRMLVASHATMFIFSRALFGLLLNATLNYILIPKVGATGAAISTATSILCANLIFPAFSTVAYNIYGSLICSVHKTKQIKQTLNTWLLGVNALKTTPKTNENE